MRISDWSSDVCSSDLMVDNTAVIVGVEAMAAIQGVELRRTPGTPRSSASVEAEIARVRERVAFVESDRYLASDIETMRQWALAAALPPELLSILPSHAESPL